MRVFGLGQFAQVMGTIVPNSGFTVHRQYVTPDSGAIPFEDLAPTTLLIAIGPGKLNQNRVKVYEEALARGHNVAGFISDMAYVKTSKIGRGTIILEMNNVQPFVEIGENVVAWSGSHFGHHSTIGAHTFVTSHCVISGGVHVGERCFLGVNCTIVDHVRIGNDCYIAAGAVVLS